MKKSLLLTITFFVTTFALSAQEVNTSTLKINEIMKGDDFVGHLPSNVNWSSDGKTIYFDWNPEGAALSDSLYGYQLKSGKIDKIDFETSYKLPSFYGTFNESKTKKVYEKYGDIYMLDIATHTIFQITNTTDRERSPYFIQNDSKIAFEKGDNIFTWTIATGATQQVTNFTDKKEKKDKKSDRDEWLMNDQLALFEVLRERKHKNDE